jgi:hypothetical protein
MQRKHFKTLGAIFARPVQSSIRWKDIESLFVSLGATIQEREGSRIAVVLLSQVQVFHRPHPSPMTDKGAVASVRRWLESHNITPETSQTQTPDEEENDEKRHDH